MTLFRVAFGDAFKTRSDCIASATQVAVRYNGNQHPAVPDGSDGKLASNETHAFQPSLAFPGQWIVAGCWGKNGADK